ncbi:hypothetical protein [Methylophaga sp.]|uniref:hypothetical protein n=1 Tax=Methylophaga sp. TaxID=2024840 RepID=UPI003A919E76
MNRGLQLALGGLRKRKFVPGVEGEGDLIPIPTDWYANPNVRTTGIVVDDITVFSTPDTTPKAIALSVAGHIRVAGVNVLDGSVPNPELDTDIRWLLTDENDNPLEDLEGLTDPDTGEPVNPYTDQYGFEYTAYGRLPITYKAKVFVRGNDGNFARVATFEKLIGPVSKNTLPETWIDLNEGDDGNDALSPHSWNGTAIYTNATKRLYSVGMFTDYDHAAASAGKVTNRYNCGYITGANEAGIPIGRFDIASKISDDEIELVDALGADYTGITFSTGPRQTAQLTVNRRLRYRGGTYTLPNSINPSYEGLREFVAYDGEVTLNTVGTADYVIDLYTNSSADVAGPSRLFLSDVVIDGANNNRTVGRSINSEKEDANLYILLDNANFIRGTGNQAFGFNYSGSRTYTHQCKLIWSGGGLDNRYLDSGATSRRGGMFFQINEGSYWRIIGTRLHADSDDNTRDHYIYATGDMSHAHAMWNNFDLGNNNAYAINVNYRTSPVIECRYTSLVGNRIGPNSLRGFDGSKTNQNYADQWGRDVLIARNKCETPFGLFAHASTTHARVTQNHGETANPDGATYFIERFEGWDVGTSPNYNIAIDGNTVKGYKLARLRQGFDRIKGTDNIVSHSGSATVLQVSSANFGNGTYFDRNNFYAPNKSGGTIFEVDGSNIDLTAFNTAVDGVNISENPEPPTAVPNAPTGLSGSAGDTQVTWTWTTSATTGANLATSQRLYRNTVDDFATAVKVGSDIPGTDTSLVDTGLTNGAIYYAWVTGVNDFGESLPSTVSSAEPFAPSPNQKIYNLADEDVATGLPSFIRSATNATAYTSFIEAGVRPGGAEGNVWRLKIDTDATNLALIIDEIGKQSVDVEMLTISKGRGDLDLSNRYAIPRAATRVKEYLDTTEPEWISGGPRPASNQLRLRSMIGGTVNTDAFVAHTVTTASWSDNWWCTRIKQTSAGVVSVKSWLYGTSEPASYQLSFTDAGNRLAGEYVGIAGYNSSTTLFAYVSVGLDGEAAPML